MESLKHQGKKILSGLVLRIRNGPLKGFRWIVVSGKHFIQGTYEPFKTDALIGLTLQNSPPPWF
jgi:hypothetical protein